MTELYVLPGSDMRPFGRPYDKMREFMLANTQLVYGKGCSWCQYGTDTFET